MIDNHELPIGFTMELAQHSDILNRFAALSHEEQERYIDGSREVESRQEMKNYVEICSAGNRPDALNQCLAIYR